MKYFGRLDVEQLAWNEMTNLVQGDRGHHQSEEDNGTGRNGYIRMVASARWSEAGEVGGPGGVGRQKTTSSVS
jgi:hypothetical protein